MRYILLANSFFVLKKFYYCHFFILKIRTIFRSLKQIFKYNNSFSLIWSWKFFSGLFNFCSRNFGRSAEPYFMLFDFKCGRKSDYRRSSVPTLKCTMQRGRDALPAIAQQRNPPFFGICCSDTQHFLSFPTHPPREGVRAAQAGRPAAGPQRSFLSFPGTLCYEFDLTPRTGLEFL
jgi:hypothetical protein